MNESDEPRFQVDYVRITRRENYRDYEDWTHAVIDRKKKQTVPGLEDISEEIASKLCAVLNYLEEDK